MFYVYVLRSERSEFYIGYTSDLQARLKAHNDGLNRSTSGRVWHVVYYEAYQSDAAARDRERILKKDGRSRYALMERLKRHLE